jgi:23S rRNA (guanine745-N1)-methyltransferase
MSLTPFQSLACPLDGHPLLRAGNSWRCTDGHCFDIASQGYANLLPVQQKRSRDPGDSKEMVAARRRFLNAGGYAPIAQFVAKAALDGLSAEAACLDAGCGEGYYLRQLAAASGERYRLAALGLDISKWAIQAAAKQDKDCAFVVGSNARLPVPPEMLDRVLCMFGFPVYGEFRRVLKPGGHLLMVDAGPEHLRELREIIYPSLKPERAPEAALPEGFASLPGDSLRYRLDLAGAERIADLLAMTPHLFRATAEGKARAAALSELSVTVDIRLTRFVRTA